MAKTKTKTINKKKTNNMAKKKTSKKNETKVENVEVTEEQRVQKALELSKKWFDNFRLDGKHDIFEVHKHMCARKGPTSKDVVSFAVKSLDDVVYAITFGVMVSYANAKFVAGEDLKWDKKTKYLSPDRFYLHEMLKEQLKYQIDLLRSQDRLVYKKPDLYDRLVEALNATPNAEDLKQIKEFVSSVARVQYDYYSMAYWESAAEAWEIKDYLTDQSFFEAYRAGLAFVVNLGGLMIGVCMPEAHRDDEFRLHNPTGPAVVWGNIVDYYWHGTKIPGEWIRNPSSLTSQIALSQENAEVRRSACEILGWDKVIQGLKHRVLDTHPDPQIGTLLSVDFEDSKDERFLMVKCGTGRDFVIPVNEANTALDAQYEIYPHIPRGLIEKKQHRA